MGNDSENNISKIVTNEIIIILKREYSAIPKKHISVNDEIILHYEFENYQDEYFIVITWFGSIGFSCDINSNPLMVSTIVSLLGETSTSDRVLVLSEDFHLCMMNKSTSEAIENYLYEWDCERPLDNPALIKF
jgi:hypothetical protein